MSDTARSELTREINDLRERVRQQDLQLARFKRTLPERRATENPLPYLDVGEYVREWLAKSVLANLPLRTVLIALDSEGRVRRVMGKSTAAEFKRLVGESWEKLLSPSDFVSWKKYHANLDQNHIDESLSLRIPSLSPYRDFKVVPLPRGDRREDLWLLLIDSAGDQESFDAGDVARRWAGAFAHELIQPLAAALASAQACRRLLGEADVPRAELVEAVDGIVSRVRRSAEVVRRLRGLACGERPHATSTDLGELLRRVLDESRGLLNEHRVKATLDVAPAIPAVLVDDVQIAQVVANLIRNAVEAMSNVPAPRRQLTVRAQFDAREATIAVEDCGVGLSVDAIQRLFRPSASSKPTGMGLGLALCRQIVEAHGGRIWASGRSPKGCLFSFSVPIHSEESQR